MYKYKNILIKNFGDKYFIKQYWKIATPAFLWAIFISLGPIFTNIFIVSVVPNNLFGINNIALNNIFNYNIYAFSYIYILSVIFIMSSFSLVGNLIAKNDLEKLNSIMKDILYLSLFISIIVTIFIAIYSIGFEQQIIGFSNTRNNNLLNESSTFLSWSSISIIFYMLNWYFIASFSSLKLIWIQCYSSIFGLLFYLMILAIYTVTIKDNNSFNNKNNICRNFAIIYDLWYFIQDFFIFIYCYIPYIYKFNKENKKIKLIKAKNLAYSYFYFLRKLNLKSDFSLLKFYFKYSYWIMIDILVWVIADIFSQVLGVRNPDPGINSNQQELYHKIILLCTQYSTYLYIFFNGFGLITNNFLASPLANAKLKEASDNTRKMFLWGFIIALLLLIIVFCISYELNMYLIGGINTPNKIDNSIGYSYKELWNMGMVMSCIYGSYMFLNIIYNNIYYFQLSGNSRLIVLSDALVSLVYAIMTWCLILTHNNFNNLFAFYTLNKSYVLWKLIIGLIIVGSKKSFNSIDKPNWLIHKKEQVK